MFEVDDFQVDGSEGKCRSGRRGQLRVEVAQIRDKTAEFDRCQFNPQRIGIAAAIEAVGRPGVVSDNVADRIVATFTIDRVISGTPGDFVVSGAAQDRVIPAQTRKHIGTAKAIDGVIFGKPNDGFVGRVTRKSSHVFSPVCRCTLKASAYQQHPGCR